MNQERTKITIESTFATVRLRAKVTQGPGSRAAGIAMAYKLIESDMTGRRWSGHLVAQATAPPVSSPHNLNTTPIGPRYRTWASNGRQSELNKQRTN